MKWISVLVDVDVLVGLEMMGNVLSLLALMHEGPEAKVTRFVTFFVGLEGVQLSTNKSRSAARYSPL